MKSGWSRPLRIHLAIVMAGLLIAVSGLIAFLNFHNGRNYAIELAKRDMRIFSDRIVENYRILSAESVMFAEMAAAADEFEQPPPQDLHAKASYLRLAIAHSRFVDGAYVGFPDGTFIQVVDVTRSPEWSTAIDAPAGTVSAMRLITKGADGQLQGQWVFYDGAMHQISETPLEPTTYDPRTRPWYLAAAGKAEVASVPPYVMSTTKELGTTVAKAHDANLGTVIGVDVVLSTLSKFLDTGKIAPNAIALVISPDGKVLLNSGGDERSIDALRSFASFHLNQPVTARIDIGGEQYLVSASMVATQSLLSGSRILVAAPRAELTRIAERALWRDLAIALSIIAVGILVAIRISRLITTSLRKLTHEAENLKHLSMAPSEQVQSRITEISALGRSMAAARTAINGFGLYVPVEIVRRILDDGHFSSRSATRQEVTALFTDIASFTTISERRSPEDVVAMLSAYFDRIDHVVQANKGSLIQFLGDSVFALWNAPLEDPDHPISACRCALALAAEIDAFNEEQRKKGLPPFRTRMGLHTGLAVVGSVGAERRLQYTSMGDTINLASRLEGINKSYGTTILVTRAVVERCGGLFVFREIDTVQAKGRDEWVTVYELVGHAGLRGSPQPAPVDAEDVSRD